MGEIDDVQHAENDREPEAQQGVEGPVDQAHQKLGEERLRADVEHLESAPGSDRPLQRGGGVSYFLRSAQVLLSSGVKASFAGIVAISL